MKLEVTKSINVDKTNTLHQFDASGIVGIQSPVGKVPIIFYMREGSDFGRRGIIYYDDYDSVCFMYPEEAHAEWCKQPYDMKYDKVVEWNNDVERGWHRKFGIFELWVTTFREWYNGRVMFRPRLKIQGCGKNYCYPEKNEPDVLEPKSKNVKHTQPAKQKINHSCGCRK